MTSLQTYLTYTPETGNRVYLAPGSMIIGRVFLGDDVSFWPGSIARGDVNTIRIGKSSNIQDGAVLHVSQPTAATPGGYPLTLGEGVTVGHKAVLHGCTIGNFCLVGIGAIVMDGAVVEDEVMIAAGALVPPGKRLETGYLYVGSPARKARALQEDERHFLIQSSLNYVKLKNAYLDQ